MPQVAGLPFDDRARGPGGGPDQGRAQEAAAPRREIPGRGDRGDEPAGDGGR